MESPNDRVSSGDVNTFKDCNIRKEMDYDDNDDDNDYDGDIDDNDDGKREFFGPDSRVGCRS